MDKALLKEFFSKINGLEGREYLLSTIAFGAAPTLKGVKPSSLVSFSARGRNLTQLWEKHQADVCRILGLSFFELKEGRDHRLVLFYNPEMLQNTIYNPENREFLNRMGYKGSMNLYQSLRLLKRRFEDMCPHEIGVFLGIPVEDVLGFITHKGEKCLFCSYWKVYHEPERARSLFKCYDRARMGVIDWLMELHLFRSSSVENAG